MDANTPNNDKAVPTGAPLLGSRAPIMWSTMIDGVEHTQCSPDSPGPAWLPFCQNTWMSNADHKKARRNARRSTYAPWRPSAAQLQLEKDDGSGGTWDGFELNGGRS